MQCNLFYLIINLLICVRNVIAFTNETIQTTSDELIFHTTPFLDNEIVDEKPSSTTTTEAPFNG